MRREAKINDLLDLLLTLFFCNTGRTNKERYLLTYLTSLVMWWNVMSRKFLSEGKTKSNNHYFLNLAYYHYLPHHMIFKWKSQRNLCYQQVLLSLDCVHSQTCLVSTYTIQILLYLYIMNISLGLKKLEFIQSLQRTKKLSLIARGYPASSWEVDSVFYLSMGQMKFLEEILQKFK